MRRTEFVCEKWLESVQAGGIEAPGQVLLSWPGWGGVQFFAEMWQAAGSARMWENRIPGSSQTLPNLKMPLLKPPLTPLTFSSSPFPLLPASLPAPFKREVRGLASKADVRFTEISSHQEGQEGLIQSGGAQSHSHSLFLDSFVSFSLFSPSIQLHYALICYLSFCPSSARAPFCLFLSQPISIHPTALR